MNNEISRARTQTGLSQSEFAQALQISPRTLQEWEQGRRSPSGSAKALIRIAIRHPEIIRESFESLKETKEAMAMAMAMAMAAMLDRMADSLLVGDEIAFSDLILDWHRSDYECQLTPKPVDTDSRKLALKASIIERLVEVLNAPPHNGNQSTPSWTNSIDGVDGIVKLQSDRLLVDEAYCEAFEKRGFLAVKNFMFFI
ncbi:helix-turn-helix protein [Alteromonadaceae bacterium 2753L.S.0a.02]|nr:helix-turn-helix protein [Alteromonadaceae bacterium 2753L.S.0a.02]